MLHENGWQQIKKTCDGNEVTHVQPGKITIWIPPKWWVWVQMVPHLQALRLQVSLLQLKPGALAAVASWGGVF